MKKTINNTTSTNQQQPTLTKGADMVVKCLEREGVDTIFAYPGGQAIDLHNALTRTDKIRVILPRHEQGGGFMAQGYARSTGKVGVCMATSGPGAMNLLTAISDAYMDSIPMVAITGQVFQRLIGKSAFQETDVFGMTLPVVKHSYLVLDANDLSHIIKEAFLIANTGRPGPVLIDIPKDVQQQMIDAKFDIEVDLPGLAEIPQASDEKLLELLEVIRSSKQPILYAGGGIISANASEELKAFADYYNIPVANTLMGIGSVDPMEDKNLYWFGMHGTYAGNTAVLNSDLLLAFGTRFSDRITGAVDKFAPNAKVVHLDIDVAEHNKNVNISLGVHSEIKYALKRLLELAKEIDSIPDYTDWLEKIQCWKKQHKYPFTYRQRKNLTAPEAISSLYKASKGNLVVTTGVGQHQMWTPQNFIFSKPRQLISSLGAGTMGFGLPSAIGAKVARPEMNVVDIDGDGSFQMNIQEMATAVMENIPVKVLLINNQFLGMVMQWEDMMYNGTRGNTILSRDPENLAGPDNLEAIYPNYCKIAEGYDWGSRRVSSRDDLDEAMKEMLDSEKPFLLEVIVEHDDHVLPFIPPGKSAQEIIVECSTCPKFNKCEIITK